MDIISPQGIFDGATRHHDQCVDESKLPSGHVVVEVLGFFLIGSIGEGFDRCSDTFVEHDVLGAFGFDSDLVFDAIGVTVCRAVLCRPGCVGDRAVEKRFEELVLLDRRSAVLHVFAAALGEGDEVVAQDLVRTVAHSDLRSYGDLVPQMLDTFGQGGIIESAGLVKQCEIPVIERVRPGGRHDEVPAATGG